MRILSEIFAFVQKSGQFVKKATILRLKKAKLWSLKSLMKHNQMSKSITTKYLT